MWRGKEEREKKKNIKIKWKEIFVNKGKEAEGRGGEWEKIRTVYIVSRYEFHKSAIIAVSKTVPVKTALRIKIMNLNIGLYS